MLIFITYFFSGLRLLSFSIVVLFTALDTLSKPLFAMAGISFMALRRTSRRILLRFCLKFLLPNYK